MVPKTRSSDGVKMADAECRAAPQMTGRPSTTLSREVKVQVLSIEQVVVAVTVRSENVDLVYEEGVQGVPRDCSQ